jgi:uncharacterized caspase-like protein
MLGFEVITVLDGTNAQMDEAVSDFAKRLVDAGVGSFNFAGHCLQSQGHNSFIPVDANITEEFHRHFALCTAALL